jgi:predicted acylesterase/phospholipase RssA
VLVDGGYVDNLPCLTMTAMGASRIFAVDVGGIDDSSLRNYGDSVSGFWFLLNKLVSPFPLTVSTDDEIDLADAGCALMFACRFNPWYRPNSGPLTLTEVTGRLT